MVGMSAEATPQITVLLPDPAQRPTLSVKECAPVLGISVWAAYAAAKRGEIPTIRIGGRVLVPTVRLLAMLGVEQ